MCYKQAKDEKKQNKDMVAFVEHMMRTPEKIKKDVCDAYVN